MITFDYNYFIVVNFAHIILIITVYIIVFIAEFCDLISQRLLVGHSGSQM